MAQDDALVDAFAREAHLTGWTNRSVAVFRQRHAATASHWSDARSLGRRLNEIADEATRETFAAGGAPLSQILMRRFDDNQSFKPAVAALARSDLLHPIDTLTRTAQTARLMWRGAGKDAAGPFRVGLLVMVYSACVLVWLADRSPDHALTRRAVTLGATLLAQR